MTNLAAALLGLGDALAEVTATAFGDSGMAASTDAGVLSALAAAGRVQRLAEAMMIAAVAEVTDRDAAVPHADRITTRYGCRSAGELVQRATRASGRTAAEVSRAAKATARRRSLSTGEALPAEFPTSRSTREAGRRAPTMGCCCAGSITARSIPAGGRSA